VSQSMLYDAAGVSMTLAVFVLIDE